MSITVLGHINPDTDTTCAAIAYAWFLNERGEQAEAVTTGALNKETTFVLSHFNLAVPPLLTQLTGQHTIGLVDTNNPEELLPGWEQATLVSVIDHHKLVGGLTTPEPITVVMEPVACTATIILGLMDQTGIVPPKEIAGVMAAAILSDTLKFTSPTTTEVDKQAAARLIDIAGLDSEQFTTDMFAAKSDLTGMSINDLLSIDGKVFTLGNEKLRVSVLETTNPAQALALRGDIEAALESSKPEDTITAAFFFVIDILNSYAELIVPSAHEREIASQAFGVEFTGNTLHLPGVVSRKKQIVPKLEAALS